MPLLRYLKVDVWFCNCVVLELHHGNSELSFGLSTVRGCDPAYSAAVLQIVCDKHGWTDLASSPVKTSCSSKVEETHFPGEGLQLIMLFGFWIVSCSSLLPCYPEVHEWRSSSHWEILLLHKSSVKIP